MSITALYYVSEALLQEIPQDFACPVLRLNSSQHLIERIINEKNQWHFITRWW